MLNREIKIESYLKSLSTRRRISQVNLAKELNIPASTLHNYLYGVKPRGLKSMVEIANRLEISLDELVFGSKSEINSTPSTDSLLEGKYELIIQKKKIGVHHE